jgi:hypothetical protein
VEAAEWSTDATVGGLLTIAIVGVIEASAAALTDASRQ